MPRDAATLIRGAYEAVNEGHLAQWASANLPPEFELVPLGRSPQGTVEFRGAEGLAKFFDDLAQVWESVHLELEDLVDFGNRVVALGRIHNRGRGSGMEVDAVAAHLWTIQDDMPVRVELIGDREEALRRGRDESSG